MSHSYIGTRSHGTNICTIVVKDHVSGRVYPLPLRLDIVHKSPSGFEWGYLGSGPAQTAFAILSHHLADQARHASVLAALGVPADEIPPEEERLGGTLGDYLALRFFQKFKARVIASLPKEGWELHADEIDRRILERHADSVST